MQRFNFALLLKASFVFVDEALKALSTMMFTEANDRSQNPNIAVFFTDGKATDKKRLFEAANEAKSKGIILYSYNNVLWIVVIF